MRLPSLSPQRIAQAASLLIFCLGTGLLVVEHVRLRRQLATVLRARTSPSSSLIRALERNDALHRFNLRDWSGRPVGPESVTANRPRTIVHFLNLRCDSCLREMPIWRDYLHIHGSADVVFVACDEVRPITTLEGLELPREHVFTIPPNVPLSSRLSYLPVTVIADACGVVTEVFRTMTDLPR